MLRDEVSQQRLMKILEYKAPFLIEKLLREQIVTDAAEAEALFAEVLRYVVLDRLYPHKRFQMYSRRIDEVWHQFILFTHEYASFCQAYLGGLLHHYPSNAPGLPTESLPPATAALAFQEFQTHYHDLFQAELPRLWFDRACITLDRRVLRDDHDGPLTLERDAETVTVSSGSGPIVSVSGIAGPALAFIARTGAFYVRELPGLEAEEQIGLVEVLLAKRVLMAGS